MNQKRVAREIARSVLEGPFGGVLRGQVFRTEVAREADYVERQRKASGLRESTQNEVREELLSRVDETFFILGSGSSVEDLPASGFRTISQGVSVGINAWVLHDFVPTAYCFEPVPNRETDHYNTLSILNRPEVVQSMPALLVLRPRTQVEFEQLHQTPIQLMSRILLYGRVAVTTRNQSNLARDTRRSLELLARRRLPFITLDSGASIVRMTSLAIQLGFKKIVYVGVDLNNTNYFWEVNPSYLAKREIASFASGQTGVRHETLSSGPRPFPVTEMIRGIKEGLADTDDLQLYSGSPNSELARFLPVFQWDQR